MINSKKKNVHIYKEIREKRDIVHKAGEKVAFNISGIILRQVSRNFTSTGFGNFLENHQVQGTSLRTMLFPH